MDIRRKTGIIIGKDGMFLVGLIIGTNQLRWSTSPWDAWITRIPANVRSVAEKTGGETWLFNPVAGQIRRIA